MAPYLLLGIILWLATLKSQNSASANVAGAICLILMIAFTGLRYEIGYDWLAYEKYFISISPNLSWSNYADCQSVLPVEYFYFLFNAIIKSLGGSVELLFFLISAFNLIVIDKMAREIDRSSRPFVWFIYFCLALVMVQFNILRQSIASSFVILSILQYCKSNRLNAAALFVIGLGFHTSIFLFFPIFFFIRRRIKMKYVFIILATSVTILIMGNVILGNLLKTIGHLLPGGFSDKTDIYASGIDGGNIWGISPFAAVLIAMYIVMLRIFLRSNRDTYVNVAILLTIAILIAHIAFGQVPIIWNRVMCVSLPWQLAVLWKYYIRPLSPEIRQSGIILGGAVSLLVTSFQLTRPENIAFVPYHSLFQVWLFGDEGDGRLRSTYAVQQGQLEQSRGSGR